MSLEQRIARLEVAAQVGTCAQCATPQIKISCVDVDAREDEPVWPTPEMPRVCACGREIEYRHIIYELHPGPSKTFVTQTALEHEQRLGAERNLV